MDIDEKDMLRFQIEKYLSEAELNRTWIDITGPYNDLAKKCGVIKNRTALTLLDLLKREFDENISDNRSRATSLRNLRYKRGWSKSSFIKHSVDSHVIDKAIKENEGMSAYDIYRLIRPDF
jgi:hypothetical protein